MGNKINDKLFEYIKADQEEKVKHILLNHRDLLNTYINKSEDYTPLMCAAFFNSCKTLTSLLSLLPNIKIKQAKKGNSITHIAAERNNFKILKEIIGKGLIDINELNAYEMDVLDCAIVNRAYETSLFLVFEKNIKLKDEEYYLNLLKILNLELFNVTLFLNCLKENTPFSSTPSFLIKVADKNKKEFLYLSNVISGHLENNYIKSSKEENNHHHKDTFNLNSPLNQIKA